MGEEWGRNGRSGDRSGEELSGVARNEVVGVGTGVKRENEWKEEWAVPRAAVGENMCGLRACA